MSDLTGKVAVVTGASEGIGQVYAQRLASDGADVVIADVSPAYDTEQIIASYGRQALSVTCDVSSPESVAELTRTVEQRFGRCDVLVNNAGIYPFQPFLEMAFEDWRKVLSVNLDGTFLMCRALAPLMRAGGWGRIINIASSESWMVAPNNLHYISSKMGVIGLTRALATELAEFGITVNALAPGFIHTAMTEKLAAPYMEILPPMQAIKRLGMPDDLAGTLSFLAGDDSAYMTGQTLIVDGGMVRL